MSKQTRVIRFKYDDDIHTLAFKYMMRELMSPPIEQLLGKNPFSAQTNDGFRNYHGTEVYGKS